MIIEILLHGYVMKKTCYTHSETLRQGEKKKFSLLLASNIFCLTNQESNCSDVLKGTRKKLCFSAFSVLSLLLFFSFFVQSKTIYYILLFAFLSQAASRQIELIFKRNICNLNPIDNGGSTTSDRVPSLASVAILTIIICHMH